MSIIDKKRNTKVKIRNNKLKNYIIYFIVIGVFLLGMVGVLGYVNTYKEEVQVVSFSEDMVDRQIVEEVLMKPKTINMNSFTDDMVLWTEREDYLGKFTGHFIRANTIVYKDMFAEEPVIRTAYLYNLDSDEELLTFPYEIGNAGGKLVTPGDRLRIRGSYKIEDGGDKGKTITEIIFDVVEVQDLLNGNNESIVDIIADANKLPLADREALMTSDTFLQKIVPRAILMVVKTEDIDTYVEFQAQENPVYTITMLTRNEELKSTELNTGNSLIELLNSVKQAETAESVQ